MRSTEIQNACEVLHDTPPVKAASCVCRCVHACVCVTSQGNSPRRCQTNQLVKSERTSDGNQTSRRRWMHKDLFAHPLFFFQLLLYRQLVGDVAEFLTALVLFKKKKERRRSDNLDFILGKKGKTQHTSCYPPPWRCTGGSGTRPLVVDSTPAKS